MEKLLLKNAQVYDGLGTDPFYADVLIADGKIGAMGKDIGGSDTPELDLSGKVLTPGFVDIHRHCDFRAFQEGFGEIELAQGITTAACGVCGMSAAPVSERDRERYYEYIKPCLGTPGVQAGFSSFPAFLDGLERQPLPINVAAHVGVGAVKTSVKGFSDTPFTAREMGDCQALLREALSSGAVGLSMGIMYTPECFSSSEELARLLEPAAGKGYVACHIRGESDILVESVREIVQAAQKAGVALEISHFKSCGMDNWKRKIFEAIEVIEQARLAGQDVTVDFYPYTKGSTTLLSLIPPTLGAGRSAGELAALLGTPEAKLALQRDIARRHDNWDNAVLGLGYDKVVISSVLYPQDEQYVGRDLASICREEGIAEPSDFIADLTARQEGQVGIIIASMCEEDVETVARLPYAAVISDSLYCDGGSPHPRLYGSFPKIIRDFVFDRRCFPFKTAIQKMTSMPAARIGLRDRGIIAPGYAADLNAFDPKNVMDRADFTHPTQLAAGMDYVFVGGKLAWQGAQRTKTCNGRLLRRA